MRKSARLIKRLVALFLVLLLSIESFGAVVSDNDGSAFITKAEFDSLKNDFQSQIDQYNTSIDAKIDGAIAAYLAGIKVAVSETVEPLVSNYTDIRWMHGPYMYFTNRKFTAYADADGNYYDTVGWQIINPENRRQTAGDGYFWFKDYLFDNFAQGAISFQMHPFDVPKGWGTGRANSHSRGPSIFVCARNEDSNWVVYNDDGGIRGEKGHNPQVIIRPHKPTSEALDENPLTYLSGVNSGYFLYNKSDDTSVTISVNSESSDVVVDYKLSNIEYRNYGVTDSGTRLYYGSVQRYADLSSKALTKFNPAVLTSAYSGNDSKLYEGSGGLNLKTGCGFADFMGRYYNRIDDGLVEDNRWKTQSQYNYDNTNFIYSMWGTDVDGDVNVAPPPIQAGEGYYLDLSGSENKVTIPVKIIRLALTIQNPYWGYQNRPDWIRYYSTPTLNSSGSAFANGEMKFNIPLFYRVNWADMYSGNIRYNDRPLSKSGGFPIVRGITKNGQIKLKIKYQEKGDTDSSVVSLTPDQKIKTYFRNKPFTDGSGDYVMGYKNLTGEGTEVSLNGTEWTGGEITVLIPVKKDDEIWMRIDPLTSDGVYCSMTSFECSFVTE